MAADAPTPSPTKPLQLALTLPSNPTTKIHIHLTLLATSLLLFLSTSNSFSDDAPSTAATAASMGSLVYAMPDRFNPKTPMATTLYTQPQSQDFVSRVAKVLVRRTGKLCYVGGSVRMEGLVEEEMEVVRAVVEVVLGELEGVGGR